MAETRTCSRKSVRLSLPQQRGARSMYPKECYFCKKCRVKYKQKIQFLVTVATEQASKTLKDKAESMDDKSLHYEIKDIDLISKEFKYHQHSYCEFTRPIKRKSAETECSYSQQGDYLKAKQIIEKNVLLHHQAISMALLHEAFGLETNDNLYHHKLKELLINDYRNKTMFLRVIITILKL